MSLVEYMESICPDILKPGSKEECTEFAAQFTAEKPYVKEAQVIQTQIIEARKHAGKEAAPVDRGNYPLITNTVLTDNEKTDILTKAFEDAGYLLHAALVYTGETRTIDANVLTKTGEKYLLTFQKVKA